MVINIEKHYFRHYANKSEVKEYGKFQVGEIITDWEGCTGCILLIFKNGDVRTDSNGMSSISKIKKVRSKEKILNYLNVLYNEDMYFLQNNYNQEIEKAR
jgi:hypothetical protein